MPNVPITLSLPESVVRDLHLYISKRRISKYIAEVIEKSLEIEKQRLAREYREANEDEDRNRENEIWDTLSGDGLNETNSY